MKQSLFLCGLGLLLGCRTVAEPPTKAITLSYSTSSQSKTDALTAGDEVAVFACKAGTDNYFLDGAKFVIGSDGHTLTYGSPVYYPEYKQAVEFFAYFPYHTGVFSVPTDQSTVAALKQADLCWATASTTPTDTPISLVFAHQMARLVVKVNQTPEKITAPNIFSGGTLDVKTGTLLDRTQSDVSTTGDVLIVPPQKLARLVLMVSGVEYVFTPTSAVDLVSGQTTVVDLTLNPISQTATLATPVVALSDWTGKAASDQAREAVDNQFLAHWLVADYRFNQINRIDLTIKDQTTNTTKDYRVSGLSMVAGSTVAAASYRFTLANVSDCYYPYTVTAVKFYQDATLVHTAPMEHGVARAGDVTLGWGQNISLTLSASSVSVGAQATSSNFTLTSNVPYTSTYTTGGSSAQGVGAQPPYTARAVTFTYPAQGWAPAAERKHVMTITPTVDYTGIPNKRTFTVTQAAVPLSLTLSSSSVSVPVSSSSSSFTLSSNVPYTSTYTSGGSSSQGVGSAPPYSSRSVTFNYPGKSASIATPAQTHVMTITPTGNDPGNANRRTFTVYQSGVPLSFSITPSTYVAADNYTSTSFRLTSNAPYTSTYTTGCSSAQGVGNAPPYNNISVTFTFPARTLAGPAETHVMTITPTGYATPLTFTVTRPLVQPTISLYGGGTVPWTGGSLTFSVSCNTSWTATTSYPGSTGSSGTGNGSCNVHITRNDTFSPRTGSVVVRTTATFPGAYNTYSSASYTIAAKPR